MQAGFGVVLKAQRVQDPKNNYKGGNMSGLFGSSSGTVQTQNNSTPWAGVQPYLTNLYARGQGVANRAPFSYTPSPYTTQAQEMTASTATNPNSPTNLASNAIGGYLSPDYLNPESNPYFRSSVNDALGLAKSQFAGQYGGAAGGNLGNSGYQEGLARTLGNVATNAYSNQYNNNVNTQLQAAAQAPAAAFANPAALSGIGQQQEAQQYNAYMSPWSNLQGYAASLQPGSQFGSSTNQTPYYQNNTANTLGILAAAAPYFFAASDVRLKTNIEKIGTRKDGLGVYEYNYIWGGPKQFGVMAQEVEKKYPEAVLNIDGYKAVNYGLLGD